MITVALPNRVIDQDQSGSRINLPRSLQQSQEPQWLTSKTAQILAAYPDLGLSQKMLLYGSHRAPDRLIEAAVEERLSTKEQIRICEFGCGSTIPTMNNSRHGCPWEARRLKHQFGDRVHVVATDTGSDSLSLLRADKHQILVGQNAAGEQILYSAVLVDDIHLPVRAKLEQIRAHGNRIEVARVDDPDFFEDLIYTAATGSTLKDSTHFSEELLEQFRQSGEKITFVAPIAPDLEREVFGIECVGNVNMGNPDKVLGKQKFDVIFVRWFPANLSLLQKYLPKIGKHLEPEGKLIFGFDDRHFRAPNSPLNIDQIRLPFPNEIELKIHDLEERVGYSSTLTITRFPKS